MATNSTQKTGFLEGILSAVGIVKSNNAKSNAKPVITTNNTSYNTSRKAHSHIDRFRPHTNNKRSAFKKPVGFRGRPYNTSMPKHLTSSHIERVKTTLNSNNSNSNNNNSNSNNNNSNSNNNNSNNTLSNSNNNNFTPSNTSSNPTSPLKGGSMYKKRHTTRRRNTRKHKHSK